MRRSIDPNESVAIIESHGMLAAARLLQVIGQETRARIVAVGPVTNSGSVTTIIAGPLAEVQQALEAARERKAMTDSAFFARPNLDTMELLIGSLAGKPVRLPNVERKGEEDTSLPLFESSENAKQGEASRSDAARSEFPKKRKASKAGRAVREARRREEIAFVRKPFIEIERMTVHNLRRYARTVPGFAIAGREISRANRDELLQRIKSHFEHHDTLTARNVMAQIHQTPN